MNFEDWVDVEGLTPAERKRLERVHALLLEAGSPASLPSGLERAPGQVITFPLWRRRGSIVAAAAAALAAACFGGGYVIGHSGGTSMKQVVVLQGAQNSLASLRVASPPVRQETIRIDLRERKRICRLRSSEVQRFPPWCAASPPRPSPFA